MKEGPWVSFMMYEFKVSEMAEEFGVHRNTIRNWINAGTLPAQEGPGRKYLMKFEDYQLLCEKFGREPLIRPEFFTQQLIILIRYLRPAPSWPEEYRRLSNGIAMNTKLFSHLADFEFIHHKAHPGPFLNGKNL